MLIRYNKIVPAATKTCAASASRMLRGYEAQIIRSMQVRTREKEKPKAMPDMRNFWPRRKFIWRSVMWIIEERRKRRRKIEVMGVSMELVGVRPMMA